MVGIIVGSGIFRTPTSIASQMGDPRLILALWVGGGFLSLAGALTYSELICMYPRSGGVYVFLREGYGRCMAFVFGWTYMLITKPSAAAGIAIVFSEYLNSLLGVSWDPRIVTTAVLVVLTAVNVRGVELGAGIAMVLTALKVLALGAIVAAALATSSSHAAHFAASPAPVPFIKAIAPVMYAIMWTYDGWSDVGAIAGEVRNPQKNLPRIYLIGTAAVMLLYVAVNAVYMGLIPLGEMRQINDVAPEVARLLLGGAGAGAVVAIVVLVSTIGSTHGSIMTGARVSFAQAQDHLLFEFLAQVHPRFATPAVALWTQMGLSITALWLLNGFDQMVSGFGFTMWIFYGLAAAVIFIMRVRRPLAERPFRCWGYPVVPGLFVVVAAAMTGLSVYGDPKNSLIWIGVLAAGIPAYFIWQRVTRDHVPAGSRGGE